MGLAPVGSLAGPPLFTARIRTLPQFLHLTPFDKLRYGANLPGAEADKANPHK